MVLLAKNKLNALTFSMSKDLIDSYISHEEFVSVNNNWKEYDDMIEAIKNPKSNK